MKAGSLVKKRWGKIEPEEAGTVGLVTACRSGHYVDDTGWAFCTVVYPFGIRYFREADLEVVSESR